jgi:hypothetical protein
VFKVEARPLNKTAGALLLAQRRLLRGGRRAQNRMLHAVRVARETPGAALSSAGWHSPSGSIGRVAQHGTGRVQLAGVASLIVVSALYVASVNAAGRPAIASKVCHAPQLRGLTLGVARLKATKAGCKLLLKGAALKQPEVQTIARQSPPAGRHSSTVTVWLNPFCRGSAAYGPEISEPRVTAGSTELVSGFYLVGGPLTQFSAPNCKRPGSPPGAGVVEVINATGALVATQTSTRGRFVKIPLPAGSYKIRGTFLNATVNGTHPTETQSLTVPTGHTVRQDFFLSIR